MAEKVVNVSVIQQRHDTVENWENKNPILLDGEQITVFFANGSIQHKTGHDGKRYKELLFDNSEIGISTKPYVKIFTALDWDNGTIMIPFTDHHQEIADNIVLAKVYMLLNGVYSDQCFAAIDTTVSVNKDKSVILLYNGVPYDGKVIIIG